MGQPCRRQIGQKTICGSSRLATAANGRVRPSDDFAVSSCSKRWVANFDAGAITRAHQKGRQYRLQLLSIVVRGVRSR